MAYAGPEDIQARLGRELDESEAQIVETRLDDAEELILVRIPDLDAKVASGEIRERLVVLVESEAVMRLIRNPEGFTAETDGNYSYQIDARVSSGRLHIDDDEWSLLGLRRGMFTIAPRLDIPSGPYHYPYEGHNWFRDEYVDWGPANYSDSGVWK